MEMRDSREDPNSDPGRRRRWVGKWKKSNDPYLENNNCLMGILSREYGMGTRKQPRSPARTICLGQLPITLPGEESKGCIRRTTEVVRRALRKERRKKPTTTQQCYLLLKPFSPPLFRSVPIDLRAIQFWLLLSSSTPFCPFRFGRRRKTPLEPTKKFYSPLPPFSFHAPQRRVGRTEGKV